jgi:hypothetical protein
MSSRASLLVTVVLLAFSALSCGGDPPDKEMQQAQSAIDTARAAGADKYAAAEYAAAVTALANAKTAVEQRDYRLALNDALDSRERAETAAAQAADGKAAARAAAERALAAAAAAISAGDAKVRGASSHLPARTVADVRAGVTDAQLRVQEARAAIRTGDFDAAMQAASAATQAIKAVTEKIDAAAAPASRRRPAR